MGNLNVAALKHLFPTNRRAKVNGANRKRVQVMLPPDTLESLNKLIGYDEQARSAAVTLAVEVLLCLTESIDDEENDRRVFALLDKVNESLQP